MPVQTRSMTKTHQATRKPMTEGHIDDIRQIHQNIHSIKNFNMTNFIKHMCHDERIMWWVIGLEEDTVQDSDIPENDYKAVYDEVHQK